MPYQMWIKSGMGRELGEEVLGEFRETKDENDYISFTAAMASFNCW
jgi:hypothetical protein